jgi:hypothetical protein
MYALLPGDCQTTENQFDELMATARAGDPETPSPARAGATG